MWIKIENNNLQRAINIVYLQPAFKKAISSSKADQDFRKIFRDIYKKNFGECRKALTFALPKKTKRNRSVFNWRQ